MADDKFIAEGNIAETAARLQAIIDVIDRNIAVEEQIGGEQSQVLMRLRALKAQLTESQAVSDPAGTAAINQLSGSLTRQNALKRIGAELDLESLDAIKAQTQARAEQVAITERLQSGAVPAAGGGVIVPRERRFTSYEQTAGVQAGAERELAEQQAYINELAGAEASGRQRTLDIELAQVKAEQARAAAIAEQNALLTSQQHRTGVTYGAMAGYGAGQEAAAAGTVVPPAQRKALIQGPTGSAESVAARGGSWTASERQLVRYNVALGEYDTFAGRADLSTQRLSGNLTRLGASEMEASSAMRAHGALTTEYLTALARGETTVSEFGYQVGATIGKFAGWTAAAGATYTALGGIFELGKGAVDASSGVQQLSRTIENLDRDAASHALINLSAGVNVPIKEASDAVFQMSRTFHDVADATTAAHLALATYKLDGVAVTESVKAMTAVHQQFGLSAQQLIPYWDELAQGQQKFNARVTEQIPILQQSAGAVKNTGASLRDFIQLSTVMLRTTQLSGSQLGTAVRRSITNQLSPVTSAGQSHRAILRMLGINPDQNYTDLLFSVLKRAGSLSGQQRNQLLVALFGTQIGGRMGGFLVGGQSLVNGPEGVRAQLSAQGARGTLQVELEKQLGTTRETMHSFINELQRLGAAFADTGVLSGFTSLLHGLVGGLGGVRTLTEGFAMLPPAVKETTLTLGALATAFMFLSRTRFGGSIAALTRLDRIPGIGPSAATTASFSLRTGTRAAQQAVQADLQRTDQQLVAISARRLELSRQAADIAARETMSEEEVVVAKEESNVVMARIATLGNEAAVLEAQRAAQYETLIGLNQQQKNLRRSPARGGYSSEQILALEAAGGPTAAEAQAMAQGVEGESAQLSLMNVAKARLARALAIERIALAEGIAYTEVTEAQIAAATGEETALAAETTVTSAAVTRAGIAARGVGAAAVGLAESTSAMVGAMNPMLAAMLVLPLVMGDISNVANQINDAAKAAQKATNEPITGLQSLQSQADALQAAAKRQAAAHISGGITGIFQNAAKGWGSLLGGSAGAGIQDWATGRDPGGAQKSESRASELRNLGDYYKHAAALFGSDAQDLAGTKSGRAELSRVSAQMKRSMYSLLQGSGLDKNTINEIWQSFLGTLQKTYGDSLGAALTKARGSDVISTLEAETTKQLGQTSQGYGVRAQAYGLGGGDLNKATGAYLVLAARMRNDYNQTDLQSLSTAQQAVITAVNKNVQDMLNAASSAGTTQEQTKDLSKAMGAVGTARQQIGRWVTQMTKRWGNIPGAVKAINNAANQLYAQLDQYVNNVLDAQLAQIKAAADLSASKVTGVSPEADLARAAIELDAVRKQLATAQAEHAPASKIAELQTAVNNSARDLAKQQSDNARAILQAQGQVSTASIMGTGPAADLARAQADVSNAAALLAFDRGHGAGKAAIASDYAALLQAQRSLQDVIRQNAQTADQDAAALIQARAGLAEAQTTDPVAQARDELAAAIKVLGTIKPTDYKTYSEYQAAVLQQQTTIAKDRQNVTQQYVDVQMSSLQFELHTQRITDQQYVSGLQQLLKLKKLTTQQRQQILTEIYDTTQQAAVSLNTDSIRMPTTYEVRRAIQSAAHAAGGRPAQWASGPVKGGDTVNNVRMNITVTKDADLKKFAQVLDDALNSNFTGSAQAMGAI